MIGAHWIFKLGYHRSNTGYDFDGNGNPTTYSSNAAVFDVENRLTSYGSLLTAGYDSFDIRAWKTDSSGTTYYLYDDDSTSPVCELSSTGTVTATNTYTVNGLVSRNTSSGSTLYEFDQGGSVSERLSSTGACTSSSGTDAFGTTSNSGTVSDPFGYVAQAGYYTDQSTGLILTTFRYYDPANGRFLNRDQISFVGGTNLYNYATNNCENRVDSIGLIARDSPLGGPQSFWECLQLAYLRYDAVTRSRGWNSRARKQLAEDIAMCIALETAERAKQAGNNINDLCQNRVPGTGVHGQPISGTPTPPWGGFPLPPILRWLPETN